MQSAFLEQSDWTAPPLPEGCAERFRRSGHTVYVGGADYLDEFVSG